MTTLVTIILLQLTPIDNYFHEINSSKEVLGAINNADYWGTVNFNPVPSYSINTYDPLSKIQYISTSVHDGSRLALWDQIIALTPENITEEELTFVDIGANIGYYSLEAAALGYNVLAYEPISSNVIKLAESIEANNFSSRIRLYQNSVSEVSGEQVLVRDSEDTKQHQGWVYGVNFVTSISLTDMMKEANVHLVKINPYGYEGNLIAEGARKMICNTVIQNVIIEIKQSNLISSFVEFMKSVGYNVLDNTEEAYILFTLEAEKADCQNGSS